MKKMKEAPPPLANFAKKEKIAVPFRIASKMYVKIPPLYYWEDVENGESIKMTMAFQYMGGVYGLSYLIEDNNFVKIDMLRKKLFGVVKESLDVLVHYGKEVMDSGGNINPRLVNEQEAIHYRYDRYWKEKVAAFNQLVRIAPITREKAVKLKLLDQPKIL